MFVCVYYLILKFLSFHILLHGRQVIIWVEILMPSRASENKITTLIINKKINNSKFKRSFVMLNIGHFITNDFG